MKEAKEVKDSGLLSVLVIATIGLVFFVAIPGLRLVFAGVPVAAAAIAAVLWRVHSKSPVDIERERRALPIFGPNLQIEIRPTVRGHPVGLVLALVMLVILVVALPMAQMFLLGAAGAGVLFAAILWLRHR